MLAVGRRPGLTHRAARPPVPTPQQAGDTRVPPVSVSLRLRPLLAQLAGAGGSGGGGPHFGAGERGRVGEEEARHGEEERRRGGAPAESSGSGGGGGGGGWGTWVVGGPEHLPEPARARILVRRCRRAHAFSALRVGEVPSLVPPQAHPNARVSLGARLAQAKREERGRVLLAVGPEGGWCANWPVLPWAATRARPQPLAHRHQPPARPRPGRTTSSSCLRATGSNRHGFASLPAVDDNNRRWCQLPEGSTAPFVLFPPTKQVSLGKRVLTTDVACIALVSAIREARNSW